VCGARNTRRSDTASAAAAAIGRREGDMERGAAVG
jgi:hypothetical protein